LANGSWQDTNERAYRYNIKHCPEDTRIVYAAPQAPSAPAVDALTEDAVEQAFKEWFATAGIWNDAITGRAWKAACAWMQKAHPAPAPKAPALSVEQPLTDEQIETLIRMHFITMKDDEGQGLHPYYKDAFRDGAKFARALLSRLP
jgi:hypothetical protein